MEGQKTDNVNNPHHYEGSTSIECIEAMEVIFDRYDVEMFCLCNAFKYIWRHKNKNGLDDLEKAQWYLNHVKEMYPELPDEEPWSSQLDDLQRLLDKKKKQWQESH